MGLRIPGEDVFSPWRLLLDLTSLWPEINVLSSLAARATKELVLADVGRPPSGSDGWSMPLKLLFAF
jgi:hypothetical protein